MRKLRGGRRSKLAAGPLDYRGELSAMRPLATGQSDRRIEAWPAATARLARARATEALKCELTVIMLYWF